MDSDKENWYRTGAAARQLNTSQHTIRELAKAGLIESQMRNGYRYIPAREIERLLSEGLPPTPANADLESTDEGSEAPDAPTRPRTRATQELYAEPSRQLARSKEKVLLMENEVETKRLQRQSRAFDRTAREEQARGRQARQVQDWRAGYIRMVAEKVPGEACGSACEKVEHLLNVVPPLTNIMPRVQEIIEAALQPIRRREQEAREVDAHRKRIADAVRAITLPRGANSEDREEAKELAMIALDENAPVGCTDRHIRKVVDDAIKPVIERIGQLEADRDRRVLDGLRGINRELMIARCRPYGATNAESNEAERLVRAALEQLPLTADFDQMHAARDKALASIQAAINQRSCLASLSRHIENNLAELEHEGAVTFEGYADRCDLRDKVARKIRPILTREVAQNSSLCEAEIKQRIADLVREHYEEFCE